MPDIPANQAVTTPPAAMQPGKPTADPPPRPGRLPAQEPQQIGAYRILEKVGEGGMGLIYKAEQRQPVRRIVALKVIKLGMDTKQVIARFDAERQALAMLSHPNVAKVLDAGMTEQGRPYFAMEYVAGIPLTDYCDHRKLTTRDRLQLFMPVCQAVQHAHQKGIIHRDLKPGNILVALFDGKPVPKVIDFGIAKATNTQLTQQTLFTQTGAMIGTPEYMSPEQAKTSGLDVDTRTDVYSLGVILYELLTGTLPFDPEELRKAGLDGMAKIIQDTEPHKPSTRITFLNSAPQPDSKCEEIAKRHRTDPKSLRRELRGDLDWIVVKAMEKDPARRYQTANALAADIKRFLENEPIAARPPSTMYRLSKMVKRHKVAMGATLVVAITLVAGLAGTIFELIRAEQARDRAMESQLAAEHAKTEAVAANIFMRDLVTAEGSSEASSHLAEAVRRLDGGWLDDQPDVAAGCRFMIARAYLTANQLPEAQKQFNSVLAVARRMKPPESQRLMGMGHLWLGNVDDNQRDFTDAATEFQAAADRFKEVPGDENDTANAYDQLSLARQNLRQPALAHTVKLEALKTRVTAVSRQIVLHPTDSQLFTRRGFLHLHLNQLSEALSDFRQAAALSPSAVLDPYYAAVLELYMGKDADYRRDAAEIMRRFGDRNDRVSASRVLLANVLSPGPLANRNRMLELINLVGVGNDTRPNLRWFALCETVGNYRCGRYPAAQQSAVRAQGASGQFTSGAADLAAAMAMYQSGNTSAARDSYRRVVQRMSTLPQLAFIARGGVGPADYLNTSDYVVCQILRREADAMFAAKPATAPTTRSNIR